MRLLKQPGSICSRFSTGKYKSVVPDIRRLAAYIYALNQDGGHRSKSSKRRSRDIYVQKSPMFFNNTGLTSLFHSDSNGD